MRENAGRLKAWREKAGLSQKRAADLIGAGQRTWADWELGGVPDLRNALLLAQITDGAVPAIGWARRRAMRKPKKRSRSVPPPPRTGTNG